MKTKFLLLLVFFTVKIFAQKEQDSLISCDSIKNGLFDKKVYTKLNGKYIMQVNANKETLFLIRTTETKSFYYVTELLMEKIKKSNCDGITIEKPIHRKSKSVPKIVRD